jgi:hypothetical protein
MAHIFRTITLVIVLTATSSVVVGSGISSVASSQTGGYRTSRIIESRVRTTTPVVQTASDIEPLTDVEQALVDWATDRFAQAGLELPELTVRFDPSRDLCRNSEGLYHHAPNGDRVVTICTRDSDTFAAQLDRRRTLLHEFGHAWDFANMSAEDHDQLGLILGADAWNDRDDVWADRGVERFAETFVFALLDQSARQLKVSIECSDLLSAFGTATGVDPLGPGLPPCAA